MSERAVDGAAGPGKRSWALFSDLNKSSDKVLLTEQLRGTEQTRVAHSCGSTLMGKS